MLIFTHKNEHNFLLQLLRLRYTLHVAKCSVLFGFCATVHTVVIKTVTRVLSGYTSDSRLYVEQPQKEAYTHNSWDRVIISTTNRSKSNIPAPVFISMFRLTFCQFPADVEWLCTLQRPGESVRTRLNATKTRLSKGVGSCNLSEQSYLGSIPEPSCERFV